ncbi:TPA: Ti-type conjugative transfer relaxase TraA [Klebsiella pneumoniae]|nr:Ti-type conjugative transfer relaxase TraA [Klebsiella pneumoniae]
MPAIPYHCSVVPHSRGKGHSATGGSAYRAGELVYDRRTGTVHDYTRKQGVEHAEIVLPNDAPVWAGSRSELWNEAELAERNKDGSDRLNARVCREMKVAFPAQLDQATRLVMVRTISQEIVSNHGTAVDFAMHQPGREGDDRNFHAHIMFGVRRLDASGFTEKTRELDDKVQGPRIIETYRERWAELCAEKLIENGFQIEGERWRWGHLKKEQQADKALERGDYEYAREVLREGAQVHLGPAVSAMERKGIETDIGTYNREIKEEGERFDSERAQKAAEIIANPEIILERITYTKAVFTERDVARELNRYIDDRAEFQNVLARISQSAELVELAPEQKHGRRTIPAKYSTREMSELESKLVGTAQELAEAKSHAVPSSIVSRTLDKYDTLSDEQRAAVEHILQPKQLGIIIGDAGTGKSFGMRVAREAWEAAGYNVRGCALAGKAADELENGSGIESRTIHSLEAQWARGKNLLSSNDVLVIDEAGMVGSRQLFRVLKAAQEAGAKVVLLGDDKQLSAIEAGAGLRGITKHVRPAELKQIRRQSQDWARAASMEAARGDMRKTLDAYNERGYVRISDTLDEAKQRAAADYLADREKGGSSVILSYVNRDVSDLNAAVREQRKAAGELQGEIEFMTERGIKSFAAGDRIVMLDNNRELGVKNGTLGTVRAAEGDRLTVDLDNGRTVSFSEREYSEIDHGYAVTLHKTQGVTVDRAYILGSSLMGRELAYVGMTRHKEQATLYAGADDFIASGKLVAHGAASYQNEPGNSSSYFATLENEKGEQRTLWGVDLERAISDAGMKIGDKCSFEVIDSEAVQLPNGQTVERNIWKANTGAELAYEKIVQRFSKEQQNESTLDYPQTAANFAERRGFDGFAVVGRLVERGIVKFAELAESLKQRVGRAIGYSEPQPEQQPQTVETPKEKAAEKPRAFWQKSYSDDDLIGGPAEPKAAPRAAPERPQETAQQEDARAAALARVKAVQERDRDAGREQPQQDTLAVFRNRLEAAQKAGDSIGIQIAERRLELAEAAAAAGKNPLHQYAKLDAQAQADVIAGWKKDKPQEYAEASRKPEPQQTQQSQQDAKAAEREKALERIRKARSKGRGGIEI